MNLELMRRHTLAFINVNPVSITFTPRAKNKMPAGGFAWSEGAPREPQTVTVIETPANPLPTVTLDGVVRTVEMEIVAPWGALIARHDVFVLQGKDYEVVDLFYDNGYETRAWVSGRG